MSTEGAPKVPSYTECPRTDKPAHVTREFISLDDERGPSIHCTNIAVAGGVRYATWFGGSYEGSTDIQVWSVLFRDLQLCRDIAKKPEGCPRMPTANGPYLDLLSVTRTARRSSIGTLYSSFPIALSLNTCTSYSKSSLLSLYGLPSGSKVTTEETLGRNLMSSFRAKTESGVEVRRRIPR